jgi:hypothetical protein
MDNAGTRESAGLEEVMDDSLDAVRMAIMEEHERTGRVNLPKWIDRYPQYRHRIIERAFWMDVAAHSDEEKPSEDGCWDTPSDSLPTLLEDALVRVLMDKEIFTDEPPTFALEDSPVRKREREEARAWAARKLAQRGEVTDGFKRAALHAWVFDGLRAGALATGRMRVGLASSLLENALRSYCGIGLGQESSGSQSLYSRYRAVDRIASKEQWYEVRGNYYRSAPKTDEARKYAIHFLWEAAKVHWMEESTVIRFTEWLIERLRHFSLADLASGVVAKMLEDKIESAAEQDSPPARNREHGQ